MFIPYTSILDPPTTTTHHFTKRDEEYLIPKPLIVLLIMIGAIFLVCVGYAIHATFGFGHDPNALKHTSAEQQEYMAEVRQRNMQGLMHEGAKSRSRGVRSGETVY